MDSLTKVKLYHISCLCSVLCNRCCQLKIIVLDKPFYAFAILVSSKHLENNRLMRFPGICFVFPRTSLAPFQKEGLCLPLPLWALMCLLCRFCSSCRGTFSCPSRAPKLSPLQPSLSSHRCLPAPGRNEALHYSSS